MWNNIEKLINLRTGDKGEPFGFVYMIKNKETDMKYIGKKQLYKTVKYQNKKDKKPKRRQTNSDWMNYWGSSNQLLHDIEELGQDFFERTILLVCFNKFDLSVWENLVQWHNQVLFRKDYYNQIINVRLPLKLKNCDLPRQVIVLKNNHEVAIPDYSVYKKLFI